MSQGDIHLVMESTKKTQKYWAAVPVNEKAEILYKAADLLIESKEEFADLLLERLQRSKKSCLGEVVRTADLLKFTADTAKSMEGKSILQISSQDLIKRKYLW